MKYDFDSVNDRRGTGCVKWDAKTPTGREADPDMIPMWVADMDFRTAPCVTEAVVRRARQGIFGYTYIQDSYYDAVRNWFSRRYDWSIEKEWIQCIHGIVPAMSVAVKALTEEGDKVIIQSPVYNCFFAAIRNHGRIISDNPLVCEKTPDGLMTWRMDFDDLERKAADPAAKMMLLCSPHNPAGRIWSPEELARVGEICRRHGVVVVSDEIHCELVQPGFRFTPYAKASEDNAKEYVAFNSPSKAFNTAGLQIANIVSPNPELRAKIGQIIEIYEMGGMNPFGVEGLKAAYNEGEPWLNELNAQIARNYQTLKEIFASEIPGFPLTRLEGTYLCWLDCRELCLRKGMNSSEIEDSLMENEKVWVNKGEMYGLDGFIRINLACPQALLIEGLKRIAKGLKRLRSCLNLL